MAQLAENPEQLSTASGETDTFATVFTFELASEVEVSVDTGDGFVVKQEGVHYDLAAGDWLTDGADVVFREGHVPAGDDRVLRRRVTVIAQNVPFGDTARFKPEASEAAYDRLTRMTQEADARLARAIIVPPGETPVTFENLQQAAQAGENAAAALETAQTALNAVGDKRDKTDPRNPTLVSTAAMAAVASPPADFGVFVSELGREGTFVWRSGNYAARVASDPLGFIYVPHATIPTSTGCWTRARGSLDLDVTWGGAVADGRTVNGVSVGTDNRAIIQAALDLLKTLDVGSLYFPPADGDYLCVGALIYASLTPLRIRGGAGTQGTYTGSGINGSVLRFKPLPGDEAEPGAFLTVESSSATPNIALTGFILEDIILFTLDQGKVAPEDGGGIGLATRGVYGAFKVDNVSIIGFASGWLADDNPTAVGAGSTRNGKLYCNSLRISRAAYRRLDLRAMAEGQIDNFAGLEESLPGYNCDLHIGTGTNGGRCDSLKFYSGYFIGNALADPEDFPDFNVIIDGIDTLHIQFTGCAFEQSKIAGVACVVSPYQTTYRTLTLRDCWTNGHQGRIFYSERANVLIDNLRGEAFHPTDAAITIVGGPGVEVPYVLSSVVSNSYIAFHGIAAVQIVNATGVRVDGVTAADYGATGGGAVVRFEATTYDCVAVKLLPVIETTTPTLAWVDLGTNNSKSVARGTQAGSAGPMFGGRAYTAITPTITAASGTITSYGATGEWLRTGDQLHFGYDIQIFDIGTAALAVYAALPPGQLAAASRFQPLPACATTGPGGLLRANTLASFNASLIEIVGQDNGFPFVNGSRFSVGGVIRVQSA